MSNEVVNKPRIPIHSGRRITVEGPGQARSVTSDHSCEEPMKRVALAVLILAVVAASALAGPPAAAGVRVRIVFPASAHAEAITGRVYVALNRVGAPATGRGGGGGPIQQAGDTGAPLFGLNVRT